MNSASLVVRRYVVLMTMFFATCAFVTVSASTAQTPTVPEASKKSQSRFHAGITIGPQFTRMNVKLTDGRKPDVDLVLGFHIGLALGLDFGPFTVRSGVNFVNPGALFDGAEVLSRDALDVTFMTVPVDLRLRIFSGGMISPYVFAGPEFRYSLDLQRRPIALSDDIRLLNATGAAGFGVSIKVPKLPFRFSPEIRYVTDLTGIYDGMLETDDGGTVETARSIRANAVRFGTLIGF